MIDVLSMRATDAVRSGSLRPSTGLVGLQGHPSQAASGTLTFQPVCPSKMARWMSAEVVGEFAQDSVRVRLLDQDGAAFFMDESSGLDIVAVDDPSQWDEQWMSADLLANLDLWTRPGLGLSVHLVRTGFDRDPRVAEVRVLLDMPTWEGAVHQAVKDIVTAVSQVTVLLVERFTLSADQQSWNVGTDFNELNLVVTELVQVTVNDRHKSARLEGGVVTLEGPPARAGDSVELALRFLPNTSVRRGQHVTTVDATPSWWCQQLVTEGGQNGSAPPIMVGCHQVRSRRVELRIVANGVASRTADALQMRAALQSALAGGVRVVFPSRREVWAHIDGLVEVITKQASNLPMCSGLVMCAFNEFVSAELVRNPRVQIGQSVLPVRTVVEATMPDGSVVESDEDSIGRIC